MQTRTSGIGYTAPAHLRVAAILLTVMLGSAAVAVEPMDSLRTARAPIGFPGLWQRGLEPNPNGDPAVEARKLDLRYRQNAARWETLKREHEDWDRRYAQLGKDIDQLSLDAAALQARQQSRKQPTPATRPSTRRTGSAWCPKESSYDNQVPTWPPSKDAQIDPKDFVDGDDRPGAGDPPTLAQPEDVYQPTTELGQAIEQDGMKSLLKPKAKRGR